MSWQAYLLIATGLVFWIAIAAVLLFSLRKSLPRGAFDWRDQLVMAFWPIAVPLVCICDFIARRRRPEEDER